MGKEKVVWVVVLLCCCGGGECLGGGEERERVIVVSMLLGCITGCVSALLCASLLSFILRYINTPPLLKGPVVFSPLLLSSSSPKSLQSALQTLTHNNTLLLNNGFTVSVYKFQLQPRLPSLNNNKKKKNMMRRIQRELHILASLRHSCLLPLLAYHVTTTTADDATTFYLVYDYLPTATTLQDAIIGSSSRLPWDARLRIAVGIIKALHYLHLSCSPPLLHYHLYPSNVLLDAHFQPRLLPLSRLANTFHPLTTTTTTTTSISPPECFPNFSIYTQKSDIFSFGVILGMLLTGRDPSDPLFGSGMGMWFRQVVEAGDAREALDKTLLGQEMEEDQMLMAVRIAAVCLSDMPLDRPSTDELLPMLTQLHSF